ncbi:MAG TPA: MFS transporter [Bryobacteraceae bacterium]|jgi:MFS family permease
MPLHRDPDFVKLWVGQAISQIGSRVTREGLPLTAVMVLGATPLEMGFLNGASAAAILTFGLFAGAWADRLRRRPILIASDLGRALLLGSVPVAALLHRLGMPQLYVIAAAAGLLTVLFDVSYQAFIPSLVGPDNLLEGNSKLAVSESVAEIAGPGLTGVLVQLLTAPIAIAVDAISFLVSAGSLALLRKPEPAPERHESPDMLREIREGISASWHNPLLRAFMLRTATAGFFGGMMGSLYVLFAIRTLGLRPAILGAVISIGGVSALCGAFLTERIVRRFGVGPTIVGSAVLTGVAAFFNPMAHGSTATAVAFLAAAQINDAGWVTYTVNETSVRQAVVPSRLLGRVNSAMHLLFRGLLPLGAFAGGALAQVIGVRSTMFVASAGFLLSSLWLIFSPVRKLRKLPASAQTA